MKKTSYKRKSTTQVSTLTAVAGAVLVISSHDASNPSTKAYKSAIYVLPIKGGTPRLVTSQVPSYWHGWSPDGQTLAYCAERDNNYDIYTTHGTLALTSNFSEAQFGKRIAAGPC